MPACIVEFPLSDGTDSVKHLVLTVGVMGRKPASEQVADAIRQPHNRMTGETRPRPGRCLENGRHFMVGQSWNDRCDHDPHRNPGLSESTDRFQAPNWG